MSKNITIYTTNTCAYCPMVKKFLTMKGQEYQEVNLDENPDRRQEAIEVSGAMTVPVTVVENGDGLKNVTVGYNPAQLASALA
jgi:glutaredoxin 3